MVLKIISLFFFTQSFVLANDNTQFDSHFLTYEQFASLPKEKKAEWLKELQIIFTEMAENSDLMAYESLFSQQSKRSPAQVSDIPEELKKLREQRRLEFLKTKGISPKEFEIIHKVVVETPLGERNSPEYQAKYAKWKAALNYVNQKEAEDRAREREEELAETRKEEEAVEAAKREIEETRRKKYAEDHAKFLAEQKLSKKERRKLREQEQAEQAKKDHENEIQRMLSRPKMSDIASKKDDLCLFAGWIIDDKPCLGPSKLPKDLKFKGINNDQLVCQNGTFLCNPLLFGVVAPKDCSSIYFHYGKGDSPCLKQVKPLCTGFNGGSPTRECASLSTNTIDYAVELIGENDKNVYVDFRLRFYGLCKDEYLKQNQNISAQKNADRLRADVQRTCQVAMERLEEVHDRFEKYIPLPPVKKPKKIETESSQR